jgi:hypothetical protein
VIATHIGVDVARPASEFTCTRCGRVNTVNPRRRKDDEFVAIDRRNYQCHDCVLVEALIQREEQQ